MTAALAFLRAGLRNGWRGWLGLALIVGLFGGAVESAAAGARRTDSAYPLLVTWSKAPDVLIYSLPGQPTFARLAPASVERLPQVTGSAMLATFTVLNPAVITLIAPASTEVPGGIWDRKLLSGRLPDPGRADEVDISFTLAQAQHWTVGDTLRVALLNAAGRPMPFRFRISGIDAAPGEFPPQYGTGIDFVWATPAFYRQNLSGLGGLPTMALRLRRGAQDMAAVVQEATRLAHGKAVDDYPFDSQAANTEHSIHLQAVALWLLAALLSIIGVLIACQLLARQAYLESTDYATLRALGTSRTQLLAAGLGRAAAIGGAGAVLALITAIALSPLFPIGLAGTAEPNPGADADWAVLGLGLITVPAVTVACAAWPAWRATANRTALRASADRQRGSGRPLLLMTAARRSVTAVIGIRLALGRGAGRTALPVRSTIAGAVVGVVALSGAMVFSSSLGHLLATPALYGTTWNADVDSPQNGSLAPAAQSIGHDAQISAWSDAYFVPVDIGLPANGPADPTVQASALALTRGHDAGSLLEPRAGRLPQGPGDIALGARTLAALHAHIGATVSVSVSGFSHRERMKVVGTAVFPTLGDTIGLGTGAALTFPGLRSLAPPGLPLPPPAGILARFRPGVSPAAGLTALSVRLERAGPFAVEGPQAPTDLVNFGEVQSMPLLLGVSLGVLALLTVAHLLITSVRRRHHDLAVLRVLGFTRGQVRSTVAWQAVTQVAVALVVGVPAGIACGRLAWIVFTDQLGTVPVIDVPLSYLAIMMAVAVLLGVAIAAPPGESAARARPALALRSE
jgi:ABC-type antimicrobial peptide transport system permease subunit